MMLLYSLSGNITTLHPHCCKPVKVTIYFITFFLCFPNFFRISGKMNSFQQSVLALRSISWSSDEKPRPVEFTRVRCKTLIEDNRGWQCNIVGWLKLSINTGGCRLRDPEVKRLHGKPKVLRSSPTSVIVNMHC